MSSDMESRSVYFSFPEFTKIGIHLWGSLLLFLGASCKEESKASAEVEPAPSGEEAGITSAEAHAILLGIVEGEKAPPPNQELEELFPALNLEHTQELAQECLDHLLFDSHSAINSSLDQATRLKRLTEWQTRQWVSHEIFERLGQLDHLKALRFISARSPSRIETEGHPIFFPDFQNDNLISILKGWGRSDPEGAVKYAMTLARQIDDDTRWGEKLVRFGDEGSFVFKAFSEWTKRDEQKAFNFLKNELSKPWTDDTRLSRMVSLPPACLWMEGASRAFCRECEFEADPHAKARQLEELFEELRPIYLDETRKWGFLFYFPHVEIATRWRRQDFPQALEWWMNYEKDRPEFRNSFHLFRFFEEGADPYTQYEVDQILKWLGENTDQWANVSYFGVIFSFLEGADQAAGLDLICSLPAESLRTSFLADLLCHPADDHFFNGAHRRHHLAPVEDVQERIRKMDLNPSEIDHIMTAIERRRELDKSQ